MRSIRYSAIVAIAFIGAAVLSISAPGAAHAQAASSAPVFDAALTGIELSDQHSNQCGTVTVKGVLTGQAAQAVDIAVTLTPVNKNGTALSGGPFSIGQAAIDGWAAGAFELSVPVDYGAVRAGRYRVTAHAITEDAVTGNNTATAASSIELERARVSQRSGTYYREYYYEEEYYYYEEPPPPPPDDDIYWIDLTLRIITLGLILFIETDDGESCSLTTGTSNVGWGAMLGSMALLGAVRCTRKMHS